MPRLHLHGWLCRDNDGILALNESKNGDPYKANSIMDDIWDFADDSWSYDDPGLGGRRAVIPNASMRVYATKEKCTLEEAVNTLIANMFGVIDTDIGYEGYSEWTITGYYCKEFTIGGHDLDKELDSYIGKYIHFIVEC